MKKLIGLLAILLISTMTVFSQNYKGDVQIMAGIGFDFTNSKYDKTTNTSTDVVFNINVESWHLFTINDAFDFGIMASLDEGIGGAVKMETYENGSKTNEVDSSHRGFAYKIAFFIAPAFAFNFGDTVRLGIAPGLSILIANALTYDTSSYTKINEFSGIGPGITVQAKFLPNKKVSPIISYRFAANFSTEYKSGEWTNGGISHSSKDKMDSIVVLTNVLTAGISINW